MRGPLEKYPVGDAKRIVTRVLGRIHMIIPLSTYLVSLGFTFH